MDPPSYGLGVRERRNLIKIRSLNHSCSDLLGADQRSDFDKIEKGEDGFPFLIYLFISIITFLLFFLFLLFKISDKLVLSPSYHW